MKRAIYAGSFDPITSGHLDILERADKLFDEVTIAVIENPEKETLFSVEERVRLIKESTGNFKHIKTDSFHGLLVEYAKKSGANIVIRGLRAVSDFDYEFQMALTNRRLYPQLETVFLMTEHKYSYLSSSLVRQIASMGGEISGMVPPVVAKALQGKYKGK